MKLCLKILFLTILASAQAFGRDLKDCANINHPAYQDEYKACLNMNTRIKLADANVDCESCMEAEQGSSTSAITGIASAIAQPLAMVLGTWAQVSFQHKTEKAWAQSYANAQAECTNRFNLYTNYNTTIGANPIGASDAQSLMSCNGYNAGNYAGYGGYMNNSLGTFNNPFQAAGYTPGFMSAWGGPYANGGTSIYGNGMMSGGIGISGYAGMTSGSSAVYQSGVTSAFGF